MDNHTLDKDEKLNNKWLSEHVEEIFFDEIFLKYQLHEPILKIKLCNDESN